MTQMGYAAALTAQRKDLTGGAHPVDQGQRRGSQTPDPMLRSVHPVSGFVGDMDVQPSKVALAGQAHGASKDRSAPLSDKQHQQSTKGM